MSRLRWKQDRLGWTAYTGFNHFAVVVERTDGTGVIWTISSFHLPKPLTHRGQCKTVAQARRLVNHRFKRWLDYAGLRPIALARDNVAQATANHTLLADLEKVRIRITDYRPGGSPRVAKEALMNALRAGLGDEEPYLLWGEH